MADASRPFALPAACPAGNRRQAARGIVEARASCRGTPQMLLAACRFRALAIAGGLRHALAHFRAGLLPLLLRNAAAGWPVHRGRAGRLDPGRTLSRLASSRRPPVPRRQHHPGGAGQAAAGANYAHFTGHYPNP